MTAHTAWATLWDTQYKGQLNMLDDEREWNGAALKLSGYSLNTHEQSELDEAAQKPIDQKPLVSTYDSVNMKRAMVQGQPLVMCWDGDALMGIDALGGDAKAKELISFVRPSEGYALGPTRWSCPSGTTAATAPTSGWTTCSTRRSWARTRAGSGTWRPRRPRTSTPTSSRSVSCRAKKSSRAPRPWTNSAQLRW